MSGVSKKSWRSWLPERARDRLRAVYLRRKIDAVDDRYSLLMESAKTEAERHNVAQAWHYAEEWAQTELSILGSKHLLRRANRWGIDIPVDAWVETEDRGSYVAATAQPRINRQITHEAFAYWEGWVKIIVPVLSLLVALAAIYFR